MKMVKRSKKQDERNVNDPFRNLPNDLNVEILMKLPPKSIVRLRFASKHLSSIILEKEFTKLYMTRSSTQPRHLISVLRGGSNMQMQRFHSFSQDHPSDSNLDEVSYKLDPNLPYVFTPSVRGLICGRDGTKMIVGNPSTGQFVSLPTVESRRQDILSAFGYDPVNDVYKVLCMKVVTKPSNMSRGGGGGDIVAWEDIMSEEHQVITLGAKQEWRMVECKYPHRPYSGYQEICRDGVMYYLASYKQKRSLMSFNLSSEDFNVIKLPEDKMLQQFGFLTNHTGKITIVSQAYSITIDLWVLEDANKEVWSKAAVVFPPVAVYGRLHRVFFAFSGILGTGEMIFSPYTFAPRTTPNPFLFIGYDPKSKKVGETVMNGIGDESDTIQVFFDHVESCMIL
ncbi:hypothetical protein Bca101_063237 [Brassica carinata]